MTTREKVEEWIKNKPKELEDFGIEVVRRDAQLHDVIGWTTPSLYPDGFRVSVHFKCKEWD